MSQRRSFLVTGRQTKFSPQGMRGQQRLCSCVIHLSHLSSELNTTFKYRSLRANHTFAALGPNMLSPAGACTVTDPIGLIMDSRNRKGVDARIQCLCTLQISCVSTFTGMIDPSEQYYSSGFKPPTSIQPVTLAIFPEPHRRFSGDCTSE